MFLLSSRFRKHNSRNRKLSFRLETLEARDVPALFATVSPDGSAAQVTVKDATTWTTNFTITPFSGFTGGVQTALADVNGDGTDDIIAAAGVGGSANLEIYNGLTGALLRTQSLGNVDTAAGVSVAAAGKNAAGNALVAVGAVINGAATVQILNLSTQTTVSSLQPFGSYDGAVTVAAADVNADAVADIVVGAGRGGGPRLAVINGATGARLYDEFLFESFFNGGINVSVGDLNADGRAEIVVGAGVTGGPRVRVLNTSTWTTTQDFFAADSANRDGVDVSIFSAAVGGATQIITRDGTNRGDAVTAYNPTTLAPIAVANYSGIPVAAFVSTVTAPTLTTPVPPVSPPTSPPVVPPPVVTDDAGMVNALPDVNAAEWQTRSNGLKVWDTVTGTGDRSVAASSTLEVYYTGWLLNGNEFDSSRSPSSPARFALTGLIQGWQQGLLGMKAGGIRRLYIPATLAYGASGSGSIPGNADIVFEIKLVSIA